MSCLERRSKQTFEDASKAKFYAVDKNFYKKLENSTLNSLLEVIKVNGYYTSY